jgi:PPM family protein phosphatase
MEIAFGTEPGVRQTPNSDACISETLTPDAVFFGVADGFGAAGQERSTALNALELVCGFLHGRRRSGIAAGDSEETLRSLLLAALDYANTRLYEAGGSTEDFVGSGASVTTMLIVGRRAFVGHIGDARAYLLRFARLEALTADDALFTDAQGGSAGIAGTLKSSLPAKPRARGLLWRSLGTHAKLEASVARVDLLAGDQVILCTDGIHGCISADEMCGVMLESEKACDAVTRLLSLTKMRGGLDNGTVIVGRDLMAFDAAPSMRRETASIGRYLLLVGASLVLATALFIIALYALHP